MNVKYYYSRLLLKPDPCPNKPKHKNKDFGGKGSLAVLAQERDELTNTESQCRLSVTAVAAATKLCSSGAPALNHISMFYYRHCTDLFAVHSIGGPLASTTLYLFYVQP